MTSTSLATGGLGVPLVSLGLMSGGVLAPAVGGHPCTVGALVTVGARSATLALSADSGTLAIEGGRTATLEGCE